MLRCPSCAVENPDTASACISCAAPLSSPSMSATVATAALSSSTTHAGMDEGRFPPGTLLAERYRIVGLLGKGGMGEVYRADDLRLGQTVALKFLPEATAADHGHALARFHNEVRIARQVSASQCLPRVRSRRSRRAAVPLHGIRGWRGPWLRCCAASAVCRGIKLSTSRASLCAGLAAAHEKGVLHRDLKPANIMIDGRGQVLLTDFGLAAVGGADGRRRSPQRHARLHGARTTRRQRSHRQERHLRARPGALRDLHRQARV